MKDKRSMSDEEKLNSYKQSLAYLESIEKSYKRNMNKNARQERTHLLCQIGGSMLKHFPELDCIAPDDINDFIFHVSRVAEVDDLYKRKLSDSAK